MCVHTWLCVGAHVTVYRWESEDNCVELVLFPPPFHMFQGWNSGHQAWVTGVFACLTVLLAPVFILLRTILTKSKRFISIGWIPQSTNYYQHFASFHFFFFTNMVRVKWYFVFLGCYYMLKDGRVCMGEENKEWSSSFSQQKLKLCDPVRHLTLWLVLIGVKCCKKQCNPIW